MIPDQRLSGIIPFNYSPSGYYSVPPFSHIASGLWVGGCVRGAELGNGFDFVLSLTSDRYELGLETDRVEMVAEDSLTQDPEIFRRAAAVVAPRVRAGEKVLVHCQAGLNRSAVVAVLVLVELGHTVREAIALLREQRGRFVLSNPSFKTWLLTGTMPPPPAADSVPVTDPMTVGDVQRFEAMLRETSADLPATTERVDKVELWRLYWMLDGRLSSPFVGALEPLPRHQRADCDYAHVPGSGFALTEHSEDDIPALNCQCGWRAADNVRALATIAAKMQTSPQSFLPIHNYIQDGGYDSPGHFEECRQEGLAAGRKAEVARMLPVPVLVRVAAHDAIKDDRMARRTEHLATEEGERVLGWLRTQTKTSVLFNGITEGLGEWRARALTIIGPVITGSVPYATANPRDLERHYRVRYLDVSRHQLTFDDVITAVSQTNTVEGWMDPPAPEQPRGNLSAFGRSPMGHLAEARGLGAALAGRTAPGLR